MFEILYLGRILNFIEAHPKESINALAATTIATVLSSHYTERKTAKSAEKVAELRVIAARVELELAALKLNAMPDA